MSETLTESVTEEIIEPYEDLDDGKSHMTHIVTPESNGHLELAGLTAQEIVDWARFTRNELVALCGYRWIPVRNPERYDLCQQCLKLAQTIMRFQG